MNETKEATIKIFGKDKPISDIVMEHMKSIETTNKERYAIMNQALALLVR